MSEEKLTLDAPELAKALGICKPRAYELMRQKDFPSIQISERRFIVPRAALDKWLLEQANHDRGAC
nr:MAG TPA: helix-turn-helix domain protein [Caudoviricetes sp.]